MSEDNKFKYRDLYKDKDFNEKIFRYIFDSAYRPDVFEDYDNESLSKAANEKIYDLIKDARSYDEARNILITAMGDEDNRDYSMFENPINEYKQWYENEGENWGVDTFKGKMDRRSLNAGGMSEKEAIAYASAVLESLGADSSPESKRALLNKILSKDGVDFSYFDVNVPVDEILVGKALDEYYDKKAGNREDLYNKLGIVYGNERSDDYAKELIAGVLARQKMINDYNDMNGAVKVVEDFAAPHISAKSSTGLAPNPADVAADALDWTGAGMIGKTNKIASLAGKSIAGSGLGALINYAHDVGDSALTTHVYADTPTQQIVDNGDVSSALEKWPQALGGFAEGGLQWLAFRGGRGARAMDFITSSPLYKKVAGKTQSAIDKIFGSKVDKINKKTQQIDKMREKAKREQEEIVDFYKNGGKTELNPDLNKNNIKLASRRNGDDFVTIANEEKKLEKMMDDYTKPKQAAAEFLVGTLLAKNAENPTFSKRALQYVLQPALSYGMEFLPK